MSQHRLVYLIAILFLLGAFGAWKADWPKLNQETVPLNLDNALITTTPPVVMGTATNPTKVQTNARVIHVTDGDTFDVELDAEPGKEFKVRMLGVNTPETVDPRRPVQCYGEQASDFTKATLSGKRIRLEADPQADERDKYGRLLRNVILEDGTDYNAKLVAEGYANAYVSFPQDPQRKTELRRLESEAKAAVRGLWDPANCSH